MSVVGKKDKVSRILISLDCILDTRLAVIMDINPSLVDKVLVNKDFNYHERLSDEFPDVDKSDFNARYSNRDITILAQSRVTNIFNFLIESNEILQTGCRGVKIRYKHLPLFTYAKRNRRYCVLF